MTTFCQVLKKQWHISACIGEQQQKKLYKKDSTTDVYLKPCETSKPFQKPLSGWLFSQKDQSRRLTGFWIRLYDWYSHLYYQHPAFHSVINKNFGCIVTDSVRMPIPTYLFFKILPLYFNQCSTSIPPENIRKT